MTDKKELIDFANERLRAFGAKLGHDIFCLDDRGECAVEVDGKFHLEIELQGETNCLFLTAEACRVGEAAAPDLFQRFLSANLISGGSSGVFFSFFPQELLILIHCSLPLEASSEDRIADSVAAMLKYADSAVDMASSGPDIPERTGGDGIYNSLA